MIQILMKVDETSSPNKTKIVISRAILRRKWASVVVVVFRSDSLVVAERLKTITTDGSDTLVWRCQYVRIQYHTTVTLLGYYNNILNTKLTANRQYTVYSRKLEIILISYSAINRNSQTGNEIRLGLSL